jgi:hypothetical protein
MDRYDYCAGILRSVRDRGGAASLSDVKNDIVTEAGDGMSLQSLENARHALVSEGNLYMDIRPIEGPRGIRKRAVFLVLVGRPAGPRSVVL